MTLPVEFTDKMKAILKDEYEDFIYCYDNDNYQGLRINPLKVRGEDYKDICDLFGCREPVAWASNGYYYSQNTRPGKHPYHEMGMYYIQEPSAMSAAALLAPEPGMRILDLCAAPGGKSTQLASYLSQEGLLVANEINPARAKILSLNIERMGIRNAIVTNEDSSRLAARFTGFFHGVLVDAPCSGEGMFRKNPEAIEEWSPANVDLCAERQAEILDNAAAMLMPGGKMVYSTCTFSREENEDSILHFLERHPEFESLDVGAEHFSDNVEDIKGAYRLWPHKLHGEGHFVAVLRKTGVLNLEERGSKEKIKPLSKDYMELVKDFAEKTLSKDFAEDILNGRLITFGDQLYLLPEEAPSLNSIRVLRCGLHIGEFKKKRFEPSHALALYMKKEQAKSAIDISSKDRRCSAFFMGESLMVPEFPEAKGWTLVCFDGYSAGWSKTSNGMAKNHYPKGLRKEVRCDIMAEVKSEEGVQ